MSEEALMVEWGAVRGDTYWDDDGGRTWVWPAFSMQALEAKVGRACCLSWQGGAWELGEHFTQVCEILQMPSI